MATKVATAPSRPKVKLTKLFIDNKWVDPVDGGEFETYNPATGEVIAKVAEAGKADVDKAVKAARKRPRNRALEHDGRRRSRPAAVQARRPDRARTPTSWPRSSRSTAARRSTTRKGDMDGVVNTLRYYAGWADKIEGRTVPVRGNFLSYTLRQPVGVVGQIIPWNFPLLMLAWKWGPALACGNTVVMKPAEQTPLTALRVAELAQEAGFPAGVINIINGLGETTGAALVAHPDVDKIAFTGHVDTAKIIQKAAADTLKRTTFELGGKSPNVDLRRRRPRRGRRRRLPRHLLPRRPVLHGRQPAVRRVEDPRGIRRTPGREGQGPQGRRPARPQDRARARRSRRSSSTRSSTTSSSARSKARRCMTGGERVGSKGFFVQPTIFDNVKDDMAIAKDEIFGPVVSVLPFKGVDEVIERANKHQLRPGRRDLDQGHRQGPPLRQEGQGRDRVGQLLPRRRHDHAVRRLQDVRPGPRKRRGGAGALHRAQDGDGQARMNRSQSRSGC